MVWAACQHMVGCMCRHMCRLTGAPLADLAARGHRERRGPWRLDKELPYMHVVTALPCPLFPQDVPYEGPLNSRSLQAAAPRIRRAAHWEQLAGAVRHPGLREALGALGGTEGR